jgi:hypothetical protein
MYPIASATLTNANIDLTSIPQTFTHLQLRIFGRDNGNVSTTSYSGTGYMQFNGDGGANYSQHYLLGNGSATASGGSTSGTSMGFPDLGGPYSGQTASVFNNVIIDILDYTNTNKNKTVKALYGADMNGYGRVFLSSGLWMSTSAINRIAIVNDSGQFATGSRVDLYGISTSNATGA